MPHQPVFSFSSAFSESVYNLSASVSARISIKYHLSFFGVFPRSYWLKKTAGRAFSLFFSLRLFMPHKNGVVLYFSAGLCCNFLRCFPRLRVPISRCTLFQIGFSFVPGKDQPPACVFLSIAVPRLALHISNQQRVDLFPFLYPECR